MAKAAVATQSVDLEPIDRLEEKVKLLVGDDRPAARATGARGRRERAAARASSTALRARLAEAEGTGAELTALRDERELIRGARRRDARADRER